MSSSENRALDIPAPDYEHNRFDLLEKTMLGPAVTKYVIHAPNVARLRKAGQFVIVRSHDDSERIPLTIADGDMAKGTITLVVQELGKSTARMTELEVGDAFNDVVGPLGKPTHVEKVGTVAMVGGGIGIAPAHPIAQAMKAAGNHVVGILGARTKELLIMEEEMRAACDELMIYTDDGSYGTKGLVTDALNKLIEEQGKPQLVVAIGPLVMMDFVTRLTRAQEIPTMVSLNPIMIDGTGMCGGCRVTVSGAPQFVCVDGPEFDAFNVDFAELKRRQQFYVEQERQAKKRYDEHHCRIGLDK
jgi:ferredoxin--NADP+ reductase